jgi:hypothetical protein
MPLFAPVTRMTLDMVRRELAGLLEMLEIEIAEVRSRCGWSGEEIDT